MDILTFRLAENACRRVCRFLWFAAVTLARPAQAEAPGVSAPPVAATTANRAFALPAAREFRLDNGLRFLVQRDARQPLLAFMVSYEVGRRDDPPGYEGLAHLVEHLSFRGSRHLGPYEGASELQKVGVLEDNGMTTPDNTVYYALLPAQYLPLVFWVESERMGFTLERFDSDSLSLEKAIIRKEELLLHRRSEVELALSSRLFPEDHPYRVTERSDAHAAGLSDVQWFFQAGYRPDKATIVVVGDVDPTLVESLARRYFGPIPNPPASLARRPIPARVFPGRERLTISRFIPSRLTMVWPAPLPGSKDDLTLRVALEIAANGRGSLASALIAENVAGGARVWLDRRDGAAFLYVEPFDGRSGYTETEYAIETYVHNLGRLGPSQAALKVARDGVRSELLRATEDPLRHAWLHLDGLRHGGRPFDLASVLAKLDATTPATVAEFARKYWSPYRRLSTWSGDLRGESTVPFGDYIQYEVFR